MSTLPATLVERAARHVANMAPTGPLARLDVDALKHLTSAIDAQLAARLPGRSMEEVAAAAKAGDELAQAVEAARLLYSHLAYLWNDAAR